MVLKKFNITRGQFSITRWGNPAFSLVEMLMALLVASLLLAALAPVMTRRLSGENIGVIGMGGSGRAPAIFKCWDYDSPELQYAADGSGYKELPNDYAIDDAWIVNFVIASGGGGGAGATASKILPDSYKEPFDEKNGIKIEFNMDDFEIESMIGGGGGGGGGAAKYSGTVCSGSPSESKCECMGGYAFDSKNNLCVSGSMGTATFSNASSKCTSLPKDANNSGWSVPTKTQLQNWSTIYSKLGITSGTKIWSRTSATGSCANSTTKYNCYCDGSYRSGYTSSSACCSGCSYGSTAPKNKNWTYITCSGHARTYNTTMYLEYCSNGCYEGVSGTLSGCQNAPNHCSFGGWGSFIRCDKKVPAKTGGDSCSASSYSSCSGYYTNYYYGTLSGSSWSTTYTTSSSNSNNVRCVYSGTGDVDTEAFYSLSGGGGGGAPAISNNQFDTNAKNKLREKIRENIGGYIVLSPGEGGKGGSGASSKGAKASNGSNGGDSCIIIQNSARQNKFKLCVKGGKGGGGADASITNAITEGYGKAGGKTTIENSCYTVDYTSTGEVKNEFACTLEGKAGGAGGASTNNPTAGGKGAASVLNSNQVANSGAEGITPNSTTNPGAGGGGGTTTKTGTGSSAKLKFGTGGEGAKGHIKLNFNRKYEAAGGGGGGAGYVAQINNISVGKSATCKIRVGYGGVGGGASIKGSDGGDSSVTCSNAPNVTYKITGGKGGAIGTSASATAGSKSTGGLGGKAGSYDDTGSIFTRLFSQGNFKGYKGLDGKQGGSGDKANYKEGVRSAGGRGGTSGTGEKGKCGGLYNEPGVCTGVVADENNNIPEPIQSALDGLGFGSGEIAFPTKNNIVEATPRFGKAGAGGGGGAWYMGKNPGKGGDGLGGYVCIYWEKLE